MALTQLADVVVPSIFGPYAGNQSTTTSKLIQSNAVILDGDFSNKLLGGGSSFNMPSWAAPDAEGEYQLPTDDATEITPVKSAAISEVAVRLAGNEAYSSASLAGQLAGSNPHDALAAHIGGIVAGKRQKMLIDQLTGLFATALTASESDIASETIAGQSAATTFNSNTFIDALAPFSDMLGDSYSMIVHPEVYAKMLKESLIDFVSVGDANLRLPLYLGHSVVTDARCPKVAGITDGFKYTSYIAAAGAIRMGTGAFSVAVDKNELAGTGSGVETLIVRDNFGFHVAGTKWTGTAAGAAPIGSELVVGSNWAKVIDTKLIPLASIVSN